LVKANRHFSVHIVVILLCRAVSLGETGER
jgi:hypothetical protein